MTLYEVHTSSFKGTYRDRHGLFVHKENALAAAKEQESRGCFFCDTVPPLYSCVANDKLVSKALEAQSEGFVWVSEVHTID